MTEGERRGAIAGVTGALRGLDIRESVIQKIVADVAQVPLTLEVEPYVAAVRDLVVWALLDALSTCPLSHATH